MTLCHTLGCMNQAEKGSEYCQTCNLKEEKCFVIEKYQHKGDSASTIANQRWENNFTAPTSMYYGETESPNRMPTFDIVRVISAAISAGLITLMGEIASNQFLAIPITHFQISDSMNVAMYESLHNIFTVIGNPACAPFIFLSVFILTYTIRPFRTIPILRM